MHHGRRRYVILAAIAIAVGIAALLARQGPDTDEGRPAQFPAVAAAPRPGTPVQRETRQPAPPVPEHEPLARQVERLMATGDPEQAFRAYRLVQDCAEFNLLQDRVIFDEAELRNWKGGSLPGYRGMTEEEKQQASALCSPMTERERQSRLDYLAIAAQAGVWGAAVAFAGEGPFGDPTALRTRPQDPLVVEWKARAIEQLTRSAESGADVGAIAYLAHAYAGSDLAEPDILLSYRYRMAELLLKEASQAPDAFLARAFAIHRAGFEDMVKDATPEERATELAAAQRIAARASAVWMSRRQR